jgi:hypothetical protein
VDPVNDDRITAFLAWRRRRALEAGLFRPEQLIDEWVFRRMLLHSPSDIYALEDLKLLTAPLFHQYGDDLLSLCRGTPTEDERPKSSRRSRDEDDRPDPRPRRVSDRPRRSETVYSRAAVRADSPPIAIHSGSLKTDRKSIEDFLPAADRGSWRGRPFEFRCSSTPFKFWETEFLEAWGALLDAISDGSVPPGSEDESAVAALTGRTRKAAKEWEQAWVKLVLRRAYEST